MGTNVEEISFKPGSHRKKNERALNSSALSQSPSIITSIHHSLSLAFQFIITIEGRGGKFNLKNTILNIGSGLALLGVTTVICDFLLMYIKEKRVVKMKK